MKFVIRTACFLLLVTGSVVRAQSPDSVYLWTGGAPGALGNEISDRPNLTIYLPPAGQASGAGVVVLPGGGYGHLAMGHEGREIAAWLNARGIAAFVLRYRLGPRYHHPVQIGDAQRAVRYVRANASKFGVAPDRIGIWGFSAGGHLASTAITHFDGGNASATDPIERASSRPDFAILAYPVITLTDPYTHQGSRRNLLGESPDPKLVEHLSNEKHITANTPPTFLFHTTDDQAVPVENSIQFYLGLRKAGVPVEMHVYEHGRHGVGLALNDPILSTWSDHLYTWLRFRGLLEK